MMNAHTLNGLSAGLMNGMHVGGISKVEAERLAERLRQGLAAYGRDVLGGSLVHANARAALAAVDAYLARGTGGTEKVLWESVEVQAVVIHGSHPRYEVRVKGETVRTEAAGKQWRTQRTAIIADAKARAAALAPTYACPNCGTSLSISQYGAAKRSGRCKACKDAA